MDWENDVAKCYQKGLVNPLKKSLQNLKSNVKQAFILHLILLGIPSSLILSVKSRWVGGFDLTDKICSALVAKVVCRRSL